MSARRSGLGRGLSALIPTGPDTEPWAVTVLPPTNASGLDTTDSEKPTFADIPIDDVVPNPRQPRRQFDDAALADLVASIREVGLLQPIVVRPAKGGGYELVMGERRWRAARIAGLTSVPAIVRHTADDAMLRDALLENLHREALNPLEEAAAYVQLLEDFGATHEDLATRVGRSRSHVTNIMRLLALPPPVQRRVAAGVLSAGHARALLSLGDAAGQERLASRIVAEGMSVRAVEEAVAIGDRQSPARRPRRAATTLGDLARRLSDRLDTRVKVEMGKTKGRIVVEFASSEDLARILDSVAPGVPVDRAELPAGADAG